MVILCTKTTYIEVVRLNCRTWTKTNSVVSPSPLR